ncbi:MAG: hypothetical protein AAGC93_24275, partial [Cyanobacteria bacterium P01_F01_bin.53]
SFYRKARPLYVCLNYSRLRLSHLTRGWSRLWLFRENQIFQQKLRTVQSKNDELWKKGWRLRILNTYVIHGQIRYTAVWVESTRDEIQVYGWKEKDFLSRNDELWEKGWRISILQIYVVNGQVLYNAIWRHSERSERHVYNWKYKDFRRKHNELRREGWRLHLLQPYRIGTELRCAAVWMYLPNRNERFILNRKYAGYRVYHDRLFADGWRLHRLTVL